MSPRERVQIRDMRVALKDMEPYVKNPDFLRTGREFTNFTLRPREFWANWLICTVNNELMGTDLIVSEDPTGGDGILFNRTDDRYVATEHVFIPPPRQNDNRTVEDLMLSQINLKINRGREYATGKCLVLFSEAIGPFHSNRVARRLAGTHYFDSITMVGLSQTDEEGNYHYWVTFLSPESNRNSVICTIKINSDFTDWTVRRAQ